MTFLTDQETKLHSLRETGEGERREKREDRGEQSNGSKAQRSVAGVGPLQGGVREERFRHLQQTPLATQGMKP